MLITLFINKKDIDKRKKIELYDNEGNLILSTKGKQIELGNKVISDYYNPSKHLLSDYIYLLIDGKRVDSCGDTILISTSKSKESIKDAPYYTNADEIIDYIKTNKNRHRKPYWVIIKTQTGNVISVYNCRFAQTEIMADFPKMTKIYIDDDILYVHRANINIIDSKLIK